MSDTLLHGVLSLGIDLIRSPHHPPDPSRLSVPHPPPQGSYFTQRTLRGAGANRLILKVTQHLRVTLAGQPCRLSVPQKAPRLERLLVNRIAKLLAPAARPILYPKYVRPACPARSR